MIMKLNFIKASEFAPNIKCSIHRNGKLGFSRSAIEFLKLNSNKSLMFAINEEDDNENLYFIIRDEIVEDAFRVNKAGSYLYLNTKSMFDKYNYDYRTTNIMFDIVKTDEIIEGNEVYKLIRREGKSREKK